MQYTPKLHQVRRVGEVLQADEIFLDRARGDEAVEDGDAARLVVRATRASAAEGLLADDSACALLVVVHVAGRVAQLVGRLQENLALTREARAGLSQRSSSADWVFLHGTGQAVLRGGVDKFEGLLKLVVLVDVDREDRAEDLLDHGHGAWVLGQDDGRLDVVALRVVARAADEDLSTGVLGLLDVARDLVERWAAAAYAPSDDERCARYTR